MVLVAPRGAAPTRVLAIRPFRRLFAAQVIALVGTGLMTVALGLLAYDLAGSSAGAILGTALAIKMLAYVFVAPIVSAMTHRLPHKRVLIGADAVRGVIAALLPLVDQVWQIYVLIFVLQAASATFTPTFQAVVPDVIEDERQYTAALSLSRIAYDLESLLSPVLAALALTVVAFDSLFVGTAVGFAASAAIVAGTRLPTRRTAADPDPFRRRATQGMAVFLHRPALRFLLATNLVVASATALVMVNTVVYVRDLGGGSTTAVAVALAFHGGGSMVVALLVPRLLTRIPDRSLMLTGCGVVVVGLVAATAWAAWPQSGWVVSGMVWAVLGAGVSMVTTPSSRLVRRESDAGNRASLFAAQFSLSHAAFLVTYPVAGWVGAATSQFTAAAVLTVLATLAATAAARSSARS